MWLEGGGLNCLHCLGVGSAELRFDRRGRPYLTCTACATRVFTRGRAALAGSAILNGVVEELATEAASDPEYALRLQRQVEDFVTRLQDRAQAVHRAPPTARGERGGTSDVEKAG